jgi:hypothetical protein
MSKVDRESIVPYPRDWYKRPKYKAIDGSLIAFFLGILLLAGIVILAVVTPVIVGWIVKALTEYGYTALPGLNTQFRIGDQTYDTATIVIDFFKGNVSKYGITAP